MPEQNRNHDCLPPKGLRVLLALLAALGLLAASGSMVLAQPPLQDSAQPPPAVSAEKAPAPAAAVYHGNMKSKKFHRSGCRYYDCKNCKAEFKTRQAAIKAGYIPCKVCRP